MIDNETSNNFSINANKEFYTKTNPEGFANNQPELLTKNDPCFKLELFNKESLKPIMEEPSKEDLISIDSNNRSLAEGKDRKISNGSEKFGVLSLTPVPEKSFDGTPNENYSMEIEGQISKTEDKIAKFEKILNSSVKEPTEKGPSSNETSTLFIKECSMTAEQNLKPTAGNSELILESKGKFCICYEDNNHTNCVCIVI